MIYLYNDPKGESVLKSSQAHSHVNSVLGSTSKKQEKQTSLPLSTLSDTADTEKEELRETLRLREETIQEKDKIILELQNALNAAPNVDSTKL